MLSSTGRFVATASSSPLKGSAKTSPTTTVQIEMPNFRTFNVKATDEFKAPVAKLARWLASNPTKSPKKYLQVRKGQNVFEKSRNFEEVIQQEWGKDLNIPNGAVSGKMHLFQSSKQERPAWNETTRVVSTYSLHVDSVKGKKTEHLKNPAKDVRDDDGENVDAESPMPRDDDLSDDVSPTSVLLFEEASSFKINTKKNEPSELEDELATVFEDSLASDGETFNEQNSYSQLDFIQSQVEELAYYNTNKVKMRKIALEKKERDFRSLCGPYGMMKPTWKRCNPKLGQASDSYRRTLNGDVAPKKTFAELP